MTPHAFGWVPDVPDQRDYTYAVPRRTRVPTKVDLRDMCPPVYDQGALGSCTANAIAGLLEIKQIQQKEPDLFTPSRLFIYYEERALEDSIGSDAGAMIRDGMKVVANTGAPPETECPTRSPSSRRSPHSKPTGTRHSARRSPTSACRRP
jgi:C1A family cysteine protease